jgi:outer membrane protein TolC
MRLKPKIGIRRCAGLALCLFLVPFTVTSQTRLTLEECHTLARENYPLLKQLNVLEESTQLSLEKTARGYLPQLMVGGQATYQSDVTAIPISLPNLHIPAMDKNQYKIYGEVVQPLTDLITVKHSHDYVKSASEVEKQKTEVELYKLRDRVNQFYFNVLLLKMQMEQTGILKKDIGAGIEKTTAAVANGVALNSNLDLLQAEMLKIGQREIEINSTLSGVLKMLGLLIGKELNEKTELEIPKVQTISADLKRPELQQFDLQLQTFDAQYKLLSAKNIPRLNVFLQAGYGRPGLNMLDSNSDFFYLGGLRLSWNLSTFYTFKKEKKLLSFNQQAIDLQKETFVMNTNIQLTQQTAEIEKLQKLIESDDEIIRLRGNIKQTSENQLENGVITTLDFLNVVNALDQARLERNLHEIKLWMAQCTFNVISGN